MRLENGGRERLMKCKTFVKYHRLDGVVLKRVAALELFASEDGTLLF